MEQKSATGKIIGVTLIVTAVGVGTYLLLAPKSAQGRPRNPQQGGQKLTPLQRKLKQLGNKVKKALKKLTSGKGGGKGNGNNGSPRGNGNNGNNNNSDYGIGNEYGAYSGDGENEDSGDYGIGSDYSGGDYSGGDYSGSDYSGSDYSGGDYSGGDYSGGDYSGGGDY